MKKIALTLLCTFITLGIHATGIIGAWERFSTSENGERLKNVLVFVDGYQVLTTFDATTGKFVKTVGGSWTFNGDVLTETVEFDTENPERVGTQTSSQVRIEENNLEILDGNLKFTRIDRGQPGALQGAWLMSGRVVDGKAQTRDTSGPRKTMKILSGTRFQWIAYNTETKQFMGTGGGTYTTINGEYTENIEFFSRDDSRVGMSLKFNYELIDGQWHHSGFSSKGDPIHEIWSLRE
ncbi:membrane or secreted protein [Gelidibacter maritimus]|uniref:Membrane or secreted protein n=1 Tax=Gelidibacter maritimus TaxID=2761487 RepID=A0A7W2M203_9FLAO|nr:membrane or secreted protein [Gelidibacter maritimus]MBA6151201.1 membrane or secreted protein [Gelidibacter maritimus]